MLGGERKRKRYHTRERERLFRGRGTRERKRRRDERERDGGTREKETEGQERKGRVRGTNERWKDEREGEPRERAEREGRTWDTTQTHTCTQKYTCMCRCFHRISHGPITSMLTLFVLTDIHVLARNFSWPYNITADVIVQCFTNRLCRHGARDVAQHALLCFKFKGVIRNSCASTCSSVQCAVSCKPARQRRNIAKTTTSFYKAHLIIISQ